MWLAEVSLSMGENGNAMALAEGSLELLRSIPNLTNWKNAEAAYVLGRATSDRASMSGMNPGRMQGEFDIGRCTAASDRCDNQQYAGIAVRIVSTKAWA